MALGGERSQRDSSAQGLHPEAEGGSRAARLPPLPSARRAGRRERRGPATLWLPLPAGPLLLPARARQPHQAPHAEPKGRPTSASPERRGASPTRTRSSLSLTFCRESPTLAPAEEAAGAPECTAEPQGRVAHRGSGPLPCATGRTGGQRAPSSSVAGPGGQHPGCLGDKRVPRVRRASATANAFVQQQPAG